MAEQDPANAEQRRLRLFDRDMQLTMVRKRRGWASEAGFSTHEILVAATVGLLVTAGFVSFNHFQIRAIHDQVSQLEVQNMDRSVLDLFTREVPSKYCDRRISWSNTTLIGLGCCNR
jgi:hypothetical protein